MSNPVIVDPNKPNDFITRFTKYISKGSLLDLGSGPGRHAAFAVNYGFDVTAVEPNKALCTELEQISGIKVINIDIASYHPDKAFSVIICAMVLHFLSYEEINQAIQLMQESTQTSGINVISAYTNHNKDNFMKDNPYGDHGYLLKIGELREMYTGWEILEYSEDWTEPGIVNTGDTPVCFHKVNMIACKPSSLIS